MMVAILCQNNFFLFTITVDSQFIVKFVAASAVNMFVVAFTKIACTLEIVTNKLVQSVIAKIKLTVP